MYTEDGGSRFFLNDSKDLPDFQRHSTEDSNFHVITGLNYYTEYEGSKHFMLKLRIVKFEAI